MAYTEIDRSDLYFNTKLYTGTGATQSITGVGFQPDWVWIKSRNDSGNHNLFDVIRGTGIYLRSNATNADSTDATSLTSFDSDGFTLGSNTDQDVNKNTINHVAWNWLASNTTASNTDGSITSTVSANTTSGFSIVSYTGTGSNATIGHGLGYVPKMIIVRNRTDVEDWPVYHGANTSAPETDYLVLNLTNATGDSSGVWNDTAPTSSVFSLGTANAVNGSGDDMIAYCFAEKKAFSKFGSYTGNGSLDGTFVYTGFKPAWVMIKRTDTTGAWIMYDNKRVGTYGLAGNVIARHLFANTSDAESSAENYNWIDFYSNGFKLREDGSTDNASGGSYIYMCFAENPLVSSAGVPCTAR